MKCLLKGLSINYELRGEGKPVILLHGYIVDHRLMYCCMEPIFREKEGYKRIYLDLPGMSKSESADWIKPTLFLMGRQDSCVGYKDTWNILDNYPRATFAVLDKAGHNLQIEQAELMNSLVIEWLDRVSLM